MILDEATVERLAQRIHERYLAAFNPGGPAWEELGAEMRDVNRAQARAIRHKLASVGAVIEPGTQVEPFTFSDAELDRLARAEHRRWVADKRRRGWIYLAVLSNRRKGHPMIRKWEKLPESEREKDRDAVRNIPAVLNAAGLRVVRRGAA